MPPQAGAVEARRPTSLASWKQIESSLSETIKVQTKIRALIDREVNPATCFSNVSGTMCRTHDYAKTVFRIVGGTFEWLKDNTGTPIVKRFTYQDDQGDYYVYEAYGRYILPTGDVVEASGAFSSRDKFFGRKGGELKDLADVDERSVRQAAQTECFKKAIFAALGYGKLSDEDAAKIGVDTSKTSGYQHKSGSKGGSTDSPEESELRGDIEKLCRKLLEMGYEHPGEPVPQKAEDVLQAVTANKEKDWGGWKSFKAIKSTQLGRIRKQLIEIYEEFNELPL
jgi:hypothetical protein